MSSTFGFPAHNDGLRKCFKCNSTGELLHEILGANPVGLPWRINEVGDYERACQRCEIIVDLSSIDHALVVSALTDFDKSDQGALGRALSRDIIVDGTTLLKGDRLEPSPAVPDTGDAFDTVTTFPMQRVFSGGVQGKP